MPKTTVTVTVAGVSLELEAPGLEIVDRAGGPQARWVATKKARKRGYLPRTVPLHYDLDSRDQAEEIAARCRTLQREMNVWLEDPGAETPLIYDGSLKSLAHIYQQHDESPYHDLRQTTRGGYDDWITALLRRYGGRRLDRLKGPDLRRWYREIAAPGPNGKPRVRLAYALVAQMLPILLHYGVELELPDCKRLSDILDRMRFRNAQPSKRTLTIEMAEAFIKKALATGTRLDRSMAIGLACQFEFTLRQIDVIGEWEKITRARRVRPGDIVVNGRVWRPGLRWEDFASGTLDLSTSKNSAEAVFDISAYPLVVRLVALVPEAERTGPLVTDEAGRPVRRRVYQDRFRELATAAGIPAEIWNMHARHGGATEGIDSGADLVDVSTHAQHSSVTVTKARYVKPTVEQTRRVARARAASRARGPAA